MVVTRRSSSSAAPLQSLTYAPRKRQTNNNKHATKIQSLARGFIARRKTRKLAIATRAKKYRARVRTSTCRRNPNCPKPPCKRTKQTSKMSSYCRKRRNANL